MAISTKHLFICLLLLTTGSCLAQACPELEKARSNERALAAFLKDQGNARRMPDCTIFAIGRLGDLNYAGKSMKGGLGANAVADLIAEYLDFEKPKVDLEPLGLHSPYPAVSALLEIGSAAQSALLKAIANEKTSDIARDNAVTTIMYLHRENQASGVTAIKTASKNEKNADAAERLRQASNNAVERCAESARAECQKIASQ